MHQIRFRPGLYCAGGTCSAPPDPLAGLRGPTSKRSGGKGTEKEGRGVVRRRGRKGEGKESKGEKEGKGPYQIIS